MLWTCLNTPERLCNGILPLTQGLGQVTCCRLWLHAAVNPSTSEKLLCIVHFWTNINILDIWKLPMKWIEYFQQAVLLCLLRALYYAGICSYAACIILCPKLCWHNSPRPTPEPGPDHWSKWRAAQQSTSERYCQWSHLWQYVLLLSLGSLRDQC